MVGGGIFALRRPRPYRRRIRTHCEEDLIVVRYFENAPPAPPQKSRFAENAYLCRETKTPHTHAPRAILPS